MGDGGPEDGGPDAPLPTLTGPATLRRPANGSDIGSMWVVGTRRPTFSWQAPDDLGALLDVLEGRQADDPLNRVLIPADLDGAWPTFEAGSAVSLEGLVEGRERPLRLAQIPQGTVFDGPRPGRQQMGP